MTLIVAYVPRPEGEAALRKGIEIAKRRQEPLVVVNASVGGHKEDASLADAFELERIQKQLDDAGVKAEIKQFVRGDNPVTEIEKLVDLLLPSVLIIGMRKRSPIGKLIMGSVAQELLMSVNCPVLSIKAGM